MGERAMTHFEDATKTTPRPGLADELWHLIRNSKKWWLLPIIFVMVVLGALMLFSATAAAPFIYTLF
jgi:hypothetical protein